MKPSKWSWYLPAWNSHVNTSRSFKESRLTIPILCPIWAHVGPYGPAWARPGRPTKKVKPDNMDCLEFAFCLCFRLCTCRVLLRLSLARCVSSDAECRYIPSNGTMATQSVRSLKINFHYGPLSSSLKTNFYYGPLSSRLKFQSDALVWNST